MKSFHENEAWEIVDVPHAGTVQQCKWVVKNKYYKFDKVHYRARLVAKGFIQKHVIDYEGPFPPMIRLREYL